MGLLLAFLFLSTWWLQSEKVSLLDDGVFLPSISEALFSLIYGGRWGRWLVMIGRCCGGCCCRRIGFSFSFSLFLFVSPILVFCFAGPRFLCVFLWGLCYVNFVFRLIIKLAFVPKKNTCIIHEFYVVVLFF